MCRLTSTTVLGLLLAIALWGGIIAGLLPIGTGLLTAAAITALAGLLTSVAGLTSIAALLTTIASSTRLLPVPTAPLLLLVGGGLRATAIAEKRNR